MAIEWSFLNYTDGRGNPIAEWFQDRRSLSVKAKAKIDRTLLQLANTKHWVRPWASNLHNYDGILEIRVFYDNIQFRLLGFRGPGPRQFTILFPAQEKNDEFIPRNAPQIAVNRMKEILLKPENAVDHLFV